MTAERSFVLRLLLLAVVVSAAVVPQESHASNLTGVAMYACDDGGEPTGDFWHTSFDPSGHLIGFTRWVPVGARKIIQFANDPSLRPEGDVSIPLDPMSHIVTLFWQFVPLQFPNDVVLNLFFNDDNLNPGISAVVPLVAAFTLFKVNPSPTTLSLYAREVPNPSSVVYDDGQVSARLGVAYYFRSAALLDIWMWRPSDLIDVDRVGMAKFGKDGFMDAVMVFELVVAPSQRATPGPAQPAPSQPIGAVVPPLEAHVGEDLWVTPSKTTPAPPDAGDQAAQTTQGRSEATPATPPELVAESPQTPTPEETPGAGNAEVTPAPTIVADTPKQGATAAAQTPTPARSLPTPSVRTAKPGGSVTPNSTPTPGKKGWFW